MKKKSIQECWSLVVPIENKNDLCERKPYFIETTENALNA